MVWGGWWDILRASNSTRTWLAGQLIICGMVAEGAKCLPCSRDSSFVFSRCLSEIQSIPPLLQDGGHPICIFGFTGPSDCKSTFDWSWTSMVCDYMSALSGLTFLTNALNVIPRNRLICELLASNGNILNNRYLSMRIAPVPLHVLSSVPHVHYRENFIPLLL